MRNTFDLISMISHPLLPLVCEATYANNTYSATITTIHGTVFVSTSHVTECLCIC